LAADEGDMWDSGKVASDETIQIVYTGKPLQSSQDFFWKVRVYDAAGDASPWSEPARWSMGLLRSQNWKAEWIGYDEPDADADTTQKADPVTFDGLKWIWTDEGDASKKVPQGTRYFARIVSLPDGKTVRKATLLMAADDSHNVLINGQKVGGGTGHTQAFEHDATEFLRGGENVVAIEVNNGGDNPAGLCGRLVIWMNGVVEPRVVDVNEAWRFSIDKPAGWEDAAKRGKPDFSAMKQSELVVAVGEPPWGVPGRRTLELPPPPYLRRAFDAPKPVKRAMVYATARGVYELYLNGQRVGRDELTPGWTEYKKRIYYNTYDVTSLVAQGRNVIGSILGDGWYSGYFSYQGKRELYGKNPSLMVQLEIEYADGSKQTIVTDPSWKCGYGPYREADLLQGSGYDARREIPAWGRAGFDDSKWKPAVVAEAPAARIEPYPGNPVRRHEEIPAKAISEPQPGVYVFDMGQNLVGWTRLKLKSQKPGARIELRHSEMLNPDGTPYLVALRQARAMDHYICQGIEAEGFEPKFTFHGFRYVEVRGLKRKPPLDAITGIAVHNEMPRSGEFTCSSANANQLFHNIIWGQKGNYLEVPTDSPQRDERLGWTGDAQFFIRTGAYNFDVSAFFTKWLIDLVQDAQHADGTFFDVAPDLLGGHGNVAWGDAGIICPYAIYQMYGDTRVISDHYDAMKRYIEFLQNNSKDFVRGVGAYGDWLNLNDATKPEVIGTAYYAYVTGLMSEMAAAIRKDDDAQKYRSLSEKVRAAFIKNFVNEDGSIKESGQTGYALAFTMDLLPAEKKEAAAEHFVRAIENKSWHLATGFIGTPRLLPALTRAGRTDVAYKLFLTETYPSWLYQVTLGATTMWERWDGWTPEKGFQDPGMNSFNHYAF
ncbi:MAG: family 78 glycoside hydrolase catalytic domain, partial [Tepidisphaeraceae bacterium]